MKKERLIPALIILIACLYTFAVFIIDRDRLLLWLNTMVGASISALLALLSGMAIFERQQKTKKENETSTLHKLLQAELSDTKRVLTSDDLLSIDFGQFKLEVLITSLQPLVIEKAALSGIYSEQDSENLLHIARKIKMFNKKIDHLLSCLRHNADENITIHACNNTESSRKAILDDINTMMNNLSLNL